MGSTVRRLIVGTTMVLGLAACGAADTVAPEITNEPTEAATATAEPSPTDSTPTPITDGADQPDELFPDVVGASARPGADGTWSFDVTLSSPYDSAERYADAWRVLAPDGTELGVRVLTHDHANEQPFTRSVSGVVIPDDVTTVTIQGRDQISGWGGTTLEVDLTSP